MHFPKTFKGKRIILFMENYQNYNETSYFPIKTNLDVIIERLKNIELRLATKQGDSDGKQE